MEQSKVQNSNVLQAWYFLIQLKGKIKLTLKHEKSGCLTFIYWLWHKFGFNCAPPQTNQNKIK